MSRIERSGVILLALVFLHGLSPSRASAQRWFNPRMGVAGAMGVGYGIGGYGRGGYGYGYGMGGYGGGTVYGSYLQGMSQVIRAQGQYNEQTSRATINYEEARTKYIDNRQKWTETYFAMREKNQAVQAEKFARQKYSPETIAAAARSNVVKPLNSEALDPITGKVYWPQILTADEYAKPRVEIEHQFELRTSTGGGTFDSVKLQEATQQMISTLKSNIHSLPTGDYIAARKFLDSLLASARS
jgi:hypothetical protein